MAIHTSVGTPTADSYVSVASANEYFQTRTNSDNWTDISSEYSTPTLATAAKENLLKQATREIDNTVRFFDSKYNQGIIGQTSYQALEFPRSSNTNSDGNPYIIEEIQYATYEQALWLRERTGKRTNEDGATITPQTIGDDSYNYMKGWINRQAKPTGNYEWQGLNY